MSTSDKPTCHLPNWYILADPNSDYCTTGYPLMPGLSMIAFTCDPVGRLMAIGWKDRFFERMDEVVTSRVDEIYEKCN